MGQPPFDITKALLRISEEIAEPDDNRQVGNSRAKLIQMLLDLLPAQANSTGLLWLVDNDNDTAAATLWIALNSISQIQAPEGLPLRVEFQRTPYEGIRSIKNSDGLSIRNLTVAQYLSGLLREQNLGQEYSEFFFPLSTSKAKKEWPIAFVQIVSNVGDLASFFPIQPSPSFVTAVSKALAARITSGRQQRINAAITNFQLVANSAKTSLELAQATSKLLLNYASAVSCAIYKRSGRYNIKLWAESSIDHYSPKLLQDTSFSYWAFSNLLRDSTGSKRKSIRLSCVGSDAEKLYPPAKNSLQNELPSTLPAETTSWLSFTVSCPGYSGQRKEKVPLLLIRLLTIQHQNFLGGAFSATDEIILTRIADYFGELLPGMLLQEAMGSIGEEAPDLQNQIRDRVARSEILLRERTFSDLIERLVPSIQHVYVAERRRRRDAEITGYWEKTGRSILQKWEFAWPKKLRLDVVKRRPEIRNAVLDIYLYEIDDRELGLRCYLDYQDLPEHEWKIIEYIVGELRFAALGALDLSEKTIQIAELRHALRAGLTGLLGHLKVATDLYSEAGQAYRDGISEIATRRVFKEAQFRKSLERARLSGEQISAFFEDTRVLLADITKESLQKTSFDPAALIDELRILFLTEVTRRRLIISTEQVTSRSIVYDRALLKLALFNLIDNAIKYSFSENVITISGEQHRGQYQFGVQNIGPFIPGGEIREQIFEPFRRIKHAGVQAMPGTGLGLAATRRIAEVHGGGIKVDSIAVDQSHGVIRARTSFTLLIPHE